MIHRWFIVAAVAVAAPDRSLDFQGRLVVGGLGCVLGALCVWFAIRFIRVAVIVQGRKMIIRNIFRSYTLDVGEIGGIAVERRTDFQDNAAWLPRVHLTDGRSIWLEGCSFGPAGRSPKPDLDPVLVASLAELCALIGFESPCDASQSPLA